MKEFLDISNRVKVALDSNKPVLALESTIISHGMPYPENVEVARKLEKLALDSGVVPATICIMNGKIKIGLTDNELELLATAKNVAKVSRREIPEIIAHRSIGATTVAATMVCADLAGIKVFATGGIGGVHRFAENSFDISADLLEFSRTPVIVVSAGAKAILDLPKTLEYLETISVPVYGYRTNKFPAFYSSVSELNVKEINGVNEISKIFNISRKLGYKNGMIIANPIPEEMEIPYDIMKKYIEQALKEASLNSITGQDVTPFLLKKIVELTQGKSLEANIKLVENNVKLGVEIAKSI